jgi:hypothetical protein
VDLNANQYLMLALVGGFLLYAGYRRKAGYSGTLGEVRDYRYDRGFLWRLSAGRLVVRERKNGGEVRVLYRSPGKTAYFPCAPAEARRIAHALRESARNPLPAPRP